MHLISKWIWKQQVLRIGAWLIWHIIGYNFLASWANVTLSRMVLIHRAVSHINSPWKEMTWKEYSLPCFESSFYFPFLKSSIHKCSWFYTKNTTNIHVNRRAHTHTVCNCHFLNNTQHAHIIILKKTPRHILTPMPTNIETELWVFLLNLVSKKKPLHRNRVEL